MIAPDLMGDDFRAWFTDRLVPLHAWAMQIIGQGRQITPAIIVFRDDNEMALMPIDLDTIDAKNTAAAIHRMTASLAFARLGAIMVSEAWAAKPATTEDDERIDRHGLEHFPGRTEIVVWSALRADRQLIAIAKITRPANRLEPIGKIIDPQRDGIHAGRFVREPAKRRAH